MNGLTLAATIAMTFAFVRCGSGGGGTGGGGSAKVDLDQDGFNAAVDCDDTDASINPDAKDVCNFKDDDCDGMVDEDEVPSLVWDDKDGDGHGDTYRPPTLVCVARTDQVGDNTDCDDTDKDVNPAAKDVCNFRDDDCDFFVDEDEPPTQVWHDKDGDTYGDPHKPAFATCVPGTGQVTNADDCDDTDKDVNPAAKDVCNFKDDDCDFFVDEDVPPTKVWHDKDGDTYGDPHKPAFATCVPGPGQVENADDCDDTDKDVNPAAKDVCNFRDDDCDFFVDEDEPPTKVWHDKDGDTYGDPHKPAFATCVPGPGQVENADDCDDTDKDVNPAAKDVCNFKDDDCDFFVDEDEPPTKVWHDKDGDTYGDPHKPAFATCVPGPGQVENADDCDDTDKDVNPAAKDICNYGDDDCDGFVDEDVPPTRVWPDDDGDTYGDAFARSYKTCSVPVGWVSRGLDCDDTASGVSPAASEVCGNGVDDDCDGDTDLDDSDCELSHCGTISKSESWTTSYKHRITCDTTVTSKAVLTLDDGIVVTFDSGTTLSAGTTGEGAIKTGPVSKGVLLTSSARAPKAGDFAGVVIGSKDTGTALYGMTLEYGGSKGSCLSFIDLPGTAVTISDFTVRNCKDDGIHIENSDVDLGDVTSTGHTGDGLVLDEDVVLSGFSSLTLTSNGGVPLVIPVNEVSNVDTLSTWTGNTDNVIEVLGGTIDDGQLWSKMPVPYRILSTITISSSSTYTAYLDLTANMTLEFDSGAGIVVGPSSSAYGSLYAYDEGLGGAIFTSSASTKAAGDWDGITLGPGDEGSGLYGVTVEYGGDNGKGNVWFQSSLGAVNNATIRHSSAYGIYRDTGASPFISGVTYTSNSSGNLK